MRPVLKLNPDGTSNSASSMFSSHSLPTWHIHPSEQESSAFSVVTLRPDTSTRDSCYLIICMFVFAVLMFVMITLIYLNVI